MNILLDCDGILADFVGSVLRLLPGDLTHEHVTSMDIQKSLALGPSNIAMLTRELCGQNFASLIKPLHGSKKFVRELKKRGEITVVTRPMTNSPTWVWERIGWLYKHFGLEHIEFTDRKDLVPGDVLIDDDPENLVTFPGRRILLDQPWNRGADLPRMYSYNEILGAL